MAKDWKKVPKQKRQYTDTEYEADRAWEFARSEEQLDLSQFEDEGEVEAWVEDWFSSQPGSGEEGGRGGYGSFGDRGIELVKEEARSAWRSEVGSRRPEPEEAPEEPEEVPEEAPEEEAPEEEAPPEAGIEEAREVPEAALPEEGRATEEETVADLERQEREVEKELAEIEGRKPRYVSPKLRAEKEPGALEEAPTVAAPVVEVPEVTVPEPRVVEPYIPPEPSTPSQAVEARVRDIERDVAEKTSPTIGNRIAETGASASRVVGSIVDGVVDRIRRLFR